MKEEEYNELLRQAIRDRILNEVKRPRDVEKVINNVYGGPLTTEKNQGLGGGVMAEMSPEDRDYWVEITREDLDEINPATKKPKGWTKKVKRYTTPRGAEPFDPGSEKKK